MRQRIGAVLDWAYASGYRETEAPMRSISKGLPRQPKKGDQHFASMPYAEVPAFMSQLRERESFSRLALQFAILTAARSGEVRGAAWDEVDLDAALWTIPRNRIVWLLAGRLCVPYITLVRDVPRCTWGERETVPCVTIDGFLHRIYFVGRLGRPGGANLGEARPPGDACVTTF